MFQFCSQESDAARKGITGKLALCSAGPVPAPEWVPAGSGKTLQFIDFGRPHFPLEVLHFGDGFCPMMAL
jgi:hypothetical protein